MSILEFAKVTFQMGSRRVSLSDLISEKALLKLQSKFSHKSPEVVNATAVELSRFLFLSAYSGKSVFFPGDHLMDEIWHVLITETAEYRNYCANIKPQSFFEHTGIKFDDYVISTGSTRTKEEQLSWLASYVNAFGPITETAFECLELAKSLAEQLRMDREQLNRFAAGLVSVADFPNNELVTVDEFCLSELMPRPAELNEDPEILSDCMRRYLRIASKRGDKGLPVTNAELELIFGISTAMGFTIWQHLSAVERLNGLDDWRKYNEELWRMLRDGSSLCGLATTHLARHGGSPLTGIPNEQGFELAGVAPWVTGMSIFDMLLVGFETEVEIVFAICDFPTVYIESESVFARHIPLCTMNSSSTVSLHFDKFQIPSKSVVSRRKKGSPVIPRPSSYSVPELGIAKKCVRRSKELCSERSNPALANAVKKIEKRIERIEAERVLPSSDFNIVFEMGETVRDSVRLMALLEGGRALRANCEIARLQLDILLLDSVFQSPSTIDLKANALSGD